MAFRKLLIPSQATRDKAWNANFVAWTFTPTVKAPPSLVSPSRCSSCGGRGQPRIWIGKKVIKIGKGKRLPIVWRFSLAVVASPPRPLLLWPANIWQRPTRRTTMRKVRTKHFLAFLYTAKGEFNTSQILIYPKCNSKLINHRISWGFMTLPPPQ